MCDILPDLVVHLFILFVNKDISLVFIKLCSQDFSRVSFFQVTNKVTHYFLIY